MSLPRVIDAMVVSWDKQPDQWGVSIKWSTGDEELRFTGTREAAERELERILLAMKTRTE
jgi:hypothetical protein